MMPVTKQNYDHYVTALHPDSFRYLSDLIKTHAVRSLLEIGTGYGHTSYQLKKDFPALKVVTLEKRPSVYDVAIQHLKDMDVTVIKTDALDYQPTASFDIIFIDASKSQQQTFVEKYLQHLTNEGLIVVDNLHISRLKKEPRTRSRRALIRKHQAFIDFLSADPGLDVRFESIGDGLAVIKKNS